MWAAGAACLDDPLRQDPELAEEPEQPQDLGAFGRGGLQLHGGPRSRRPEGVLSTFRVLQNILARMKVSPGTEYQPRNSL